MVSRRSLLAASLSSALLAMSWPALARGPRGAPPPIPALPLSIAVAEEDGLPVRDDAWVDAQIAEATRLFAAIGVPLRKHGKRTLAARFARIETRDDRDALAGEMEAKRINVMVVGSLRDVDDPSLYRMGVHWRNRSAPSKHYVIAAASARATTLAHELGHYFGLGHTDVPDNVMSYARTGGAVSFDDRQGTTIRAFVRMYLGAKLIEP
jgi:hypothetical protein